MLKPYRSIARRALAVLVCGLAGLALLATSTTSFAGSHLFNVWHNRNATSPAECFSVMSAWGQPAYPRTGYYSGRASWFLIHGHVTWAQAWARVEQSLIQMAARRSGCGFGGSRQRHAAAVGVANQIINDIRRDRHRAQQHAQPRRGGGGYGNYRGRSQSRGADPYALGEAIGRSLGELLGGKSSRGGYRGSRPPSGRGSGHSDYRGSQRQQSGSRQGACVGIFDLRPHCQERVRSGGPIR